MDDDYITTGEAATILDLTPDYVARLVLGGEMHSLPRSRANSPYSLSRASVLAFKERRRPRMAPGHCTALEAARILGLSLSYTRYIGTRGLLGGQARARGRPHQFSLAAVHDYARVLARLRAEHKAPPPKPPVRTSHKPTLTPDEVTIWIRCTCETLDVSQQMLLSAHRDIETVEARRVLIWLLSNDRGFGPTYVGRIVGRDHSTVMHNVARAKAILTGRCGKSAKEQLQWGVSYTRAAIAATLSSCKNTGNIPVMPFGSGQKGKGTWLRSSR